jgi:cation diffusion facilitator CzcD-associated flavoprotein CzcO
MVGLNAAIKLKAAGFNFRMIERCEDVGGTWLVNTYPNVAVDTPSVQYSYSFEQNASWTKYYPRGPEYHSYLRSVFQKYQLAENTDFGTSMEACIWDEDREIWRVTCTRDGQIVTYEARIVISALGFLSRPSWPAVANLEDFAGPVIHSGQWDDSVELEGKRVVVVGTGATSAQLATAAGARARHLTVIQRQPNYMMPDERTLIDVGPDERWALENIPYVTQWRRFQSLLGMATNRVSPATIDTEYRARTGAVSPLNEGARQVSLNYIERKFADRPDLKAKVTPDFPFFAKRPILDCGYYDTLKRSNVDLVVGTLDRCEEDAVVLADGTRINCDVLLLATGYKLDFLRGLDIRGRNGRSLEATWTPHPFAYKGLEVPGFPNLFITSGPNSGLTASHTTLGEQQVHYIIETLKLMVEGDLSAVEVSEDACNAYNADLDRKLETTVWVQNGTAHGYYRHTSGKIVLGYPDVNLDYWLKLRQPVASDHHLSAKSEEGAAPNKLMAALS